MEFNEYIEQKRAEIADVRKQKIEEEANKASSQKKDEKKTGLILEFYQILDNSCDVISEALFGKMKNLNNENLKINFITSRKLKQTTKKNSKKKMSEKK